MSDSGPKVTPREAALVRALREAAKLLHGPTDAGDASFHMGTFERCPNPGCTARRAALKEATEGQQPALAGGEAQAWKEDAGGAKLRLGRLLLSVHAANKVGGESSSAFRWSVGARGVCPSYAEAQTAALAAAAPEGAARKPAAEELAALFLMRQAIAARRGGDTAEASGWIHEALALLEKLAEGPAAPASTTLPSNGDSKETQ